jgi:hypothetical protein
LLAPAIILGTPAEAGLNQKIEKEGGRENLKPYQILIPTLQFSDQVPPRSSLPIFIILSERYHEILAGLRF